jgi:hypothetical protein
MHFLVSALITLQNFDQFTDGKEVPRIKRCQEGQRGEETVSRRNSWIHHFATLFLRKVP